MGEVDGSEPLQEIRIDKITEANFNDRKQIDSMNLYQGCGRNKLIPVDNQKYSNTSHWIVPCVVLN